MRAGNSVQLQKLSLVNSLFYSLFKTIQTGSDEMAKAERPLELYGVHPFLRPSAATSHLRRQADADHLEFFLTLTAAAGVVMLALWIAAKIILFSLKEAEV